MKVRLPDVNVLVALAWPSHVHHAPAHRWFSLTAPNGWATCPFTQCGFIRISSNRRIIAEAVSPRSAVRLLREMTQQGRHIFWPDDLDFNVDQEIPIDLLMGHGQVTDAYLLGMSIRQDGKLVTFDRSVSALLPATSPYRDVIEVIPHP